MFTQTSERLKAGGLKATAINKYNHLPIWTTDDLQSAWIWSLMGEIIRTVSCMIRWTNSKDIQTFKKTSLLKKGFGPFLDLMHWHLLTFKSPKAVPHTHTHTHARPWKWLSVHLRGEGGGVKGCPSVPPSLHQAPRLAFHPATWAPLLGPGSYFSSGNHLLKTDFRKPRCPWAALSINQTAEMPLFTIPALDREYPLPSQLTVYLQSVSTTSGTGRSCRLTIPTLGSVEHGHVNIHMCVSTHLRPYPVCSRCRCRCPWAGSKCRSPGLECCCCSWGYTGWGWKHNN